MEAEHVEPPQLQTDRQVGHMIRERDGKVGHMIGQAESQVGHMIRVRDW